MGESALDFIDRVTRIATQLERLMVLVFIGVDFLAEHRASINWSTHTFEVQGGITEVPLITSHDKSYLVTSVSEIKIKSNCEVLFPVGVQGIRSSTDVFLLEPLSSTPTKFGVLGVKCIWQIEQGKTVYKVLNYTN